MVLKASFSKTVILILTLGCLAIYSLAIVCQSVLPGSTVVICHHSMVTGAAAAVGGTAVGCATGAAVGCATGAAVGCATGAAVGGTGVAAGAHAEITRATITRTAAKRNTR